MTTAPITNVVDPVSLPMPRTDDGGAGPVQSVSMRGVVLMEAERGARAVVATRAVRLLSAGRVKLPLLTTTVLVRNAIVIDVCCVCVRANVCCVWVMASFRIGWHGDR